VHAKRTVRPALQEEGLAGPQTCKALPISDWTFYLWRQRYGASKEDEAQLLKAPGVWSPARSSS